MNEKVLEKIKAGLEEVQNGCRANLMTVEEIVKSLEKAEVYVKELIKIDPKFHKATSYEYYRGERKKGYNYATTGVNATFNSSGEARLVTVWRDKKGYWEERVNFDNSKLKKDGIELTEREIKILRKAFNLTSNMRKNL